MPAINRYYSSNAVRTTTTATLTSIATSVPVAATTGFPPSVPFTLVLDEGQVSEEIVTVTAVTSLTLTIIRGVDGTSGVSHSLGAKAVHALTARDLREPQEHIAAEATIHGSTGALLDVGRVQTVTAAKTFTASGAAVTPVVVQAAAGQTATITEWRNSAAAAMFAINAAGQPKFYASQTTATAGTITPPALVLGYLVCDVGGTLVKVPYYNV